MRSFLPIRSLVLSAAFFLGACSAARTDPYAGAAVGGVSGAAVGAGTGAIVGSVIKNGNVGKSALLGGAIGLPAGILLGVAYTNSVQNSEIADNAEMIQANRQKILQQEHELEYMRNSIRDDSSSKAVQPDPSRIEYRYLGPSLGNPKR